MNTPVSTAAIRKTTFAVSALSILPHIFCCGIPAAAALIALGTTVGLGAALAGNPFYQFVDTYHSELLAVAIASVILSGILNLVAYRMDCRTAATSACNHGDCKPKKSHAFRVFFLSLALLMVDIGWFVAEEHVLGLHHHEHHEEHAH
jgi:hypothetical protein